MNLPVPQTLTAGYVIVGVMIEVSLPVVIAVLGTLFLVLLVQRFWNTLKSLVTLPATVKKVADELENLRNQGDTYVKYVGGFIQTCESQVAAHDRLNATVERLVSAIVAPKADRPAVDEVQNYDESQADRTYRVQQYMASGLTRENAETRARSEEAEVLLAPFRHLVDGD